MNIPTVYLMDVIKAANPVEVLPKALAKQNSLKRSLFYLIFDSFFIAFSMFSAFYLRFEGKIPQNFIAGMGIFILLALSVKISFIYYSGLYKVSWAYMGLRDLFSLVKSLFIASFVFGTILFFFREYSLLSTFPRSILIIDYMLTVFFLESFRISRRVYLQYKGRMPLKGERILIIGAGDTGEQIVRGMLNSQGYFPVGFLDDDPGKIGSTIHGVKVLGKRDDIAKIVRDHKVESILIAMPSVLSQVIRETVAMSRNAGIKKIKLIPGLHEIISGKVTISDIKEVELEDLLGREQVEIDTKSIGKYLDGKNVLVSGASGSIGSELCKQILKFNPKALVALDQDETGLFFLKRIIEDARLIPVVGNIRDPNKIDHLFQYFKPCVVFHAAAYKHVPVMEEHPDEAVKNNVFGTLLMGEASIKYGVEKFILVSTDKAVNPTSVMGATKRLAEKIVVDLNKRNHTQFAAVRFGNVLGSRGSVIPIFRNQIKNGGPVEVTHPEIKRYFMVTSEAVLLILQAGAIAEGGEVFVLDMGEPVKIVDLAREMIRLSGFEPDKDILIKFTGLRRGEKLYEDLLTSEEGIDSTRHKMIFKARLNSRLRNGELSENLEKMKGLCEERKCEEIISLMKSMIYTYNPAR